MADRYPNMTIYIEEHPGGDEYGYVISSLVYLGPGDGDTEDGPISGSADSEREAIREMKAQADRYVAGGDFQYVEVLSEGTQEYFAEPKTRKPRAKKAKKSHPGQGTLFGMRRR